MGCGGIIRILFGEYFFQKYRKILLEKVSQNTFGKSIAKKYVILLEKPLENTFR